MLITKELITNILSSTKSDDDFAQILTSLMGGKSREHTESTGNEELLEEKVNLLLDGEEEAIQPGDLVTWKKGLKNKKHPQEDQPAKVIAIDAPFINDKEDAGSPYYGEKLNLELAIIDEDGELLIYHYDKRRFKVAKKASTD